MSASRCDVLTPDSITQQNPESLNMALGVWKGANEVAGLTIFGGVRPSRLMIR